MTTGQRPSDGYIKANASDQGGQCVLVRRKAGEHTVFIRDSKYQRDPRDRPEDEPIIEMPAAAWNAFEARAMDRAATEAAAGHPDIEHTDGGSVVIRGTDGTTLVFTKSEWTAFQSGLALGEFEPQPVAA